MIALFIFASALIQVYATNNCSSKISNYIQKRACPSDLVDRLNAHDWNYVAVPSSDLTDDILCIKDSFSGDKGQMTTYYNDGKEATVVNSTYETLGCGYFKATASTGDFNTVIIFTTEVDRVVGYYLCRDTNTDGHDNGGCMCTAGADVVNDPEIGKGLKQCKTWLIAAGIEGVTSLAPCSSS